MNIHIEANGLGISVTKFEKFPEDPLKYYIGNRNGYIGYLDFHKHKLKFCYSGISGKYYDLIPKEE